jgi:porphobilinogen deaminase
MAMTRQLKLGTRGSPLALFQANLVARLLRGAHPDLAVEI